MNARVAPRVIGDRLVLDVAGFAALLEQLRATGHQLVGPTVRDGAIVFGDIQQLEDLPRGWTDEQEAGRYRLRRRDDNAFFGYAVGPQSLKQFLFVPKLQLVRLHLLSGEQLPRIC